MSCFFRSAGGCCFLGFIDDVRVISAAVEKVCVCCTIRILWWSLSSHRFLLFLENKFARGDSAVCPQETFPLVDFRSFAFFSPLLHLQKRNLGLLSASASRFAGSEILRCWFMSSLSVHRPNVFSGSLQHKCRCGIYEDFCLANQSLPLQGQR